MIALALKESYIYYTENIYFDTLNPCNIVFLAIYLVLPMVELNWCKKIIEQTCQQGYREQHFSRLVTYEFHLSSVNSDVSQVMVGLTHSMSHTELFSMYIVCSYYVHL